MMAGKLGRLFNTLEDVLLLLLVLTMLVLSFSQLVLRNLDMGGMAWSDAAVRINVLWLAMFGAMRASRMQRHISIDVLTRYLPASWRKPLHFVVSLSCAGICSWAAWYSLKFVILEHEDGALAFLNVPVWLCEAIIPMALATIALRFLFYALTPPEQDADLA